MDSCAESALSPTPCCASDFVGDRTGLTPEPDPVESDLIHIYIISPDLEIKSDVSFLKKYEGRREVYEVAFERAIRECGSINQEDLVRITSLNQEELLLWLRETHQHVKQPREKMVSICEPQSLSNSEGQ